MVYPLVCLATLTVGKTVLVVVTVQGPPGARVLSYYKDARHHVYSKQVVTLARDQHAPIRGCHGKCCSTVFTGEMCPPYSLSVCTALPIRYDARAMTSISGQLTTPRRRCTQLLTAHSPLLPTYAHHPFFLCLRHRISLPSFNPFSMLPCPTMPNKQA